MDRQLETLRPALDLHEFLDGIRDFVAIPDLEDDRAEGREVPLPPPRHRLKLGPRDEALLVAVLEHNDERFDGRREEGEEGVGWPEPDAEVCEAGCGERREEGVTEFLCLEGDVEGLEVREGGEKVGEGVEGGGRGAGEVKGDEVGEGEAEEAREVAVARRESETPKGWGLIAFGGGAPELDTVEVY